MKNRRSSRSGTTSEPLIHRFGNSVLLLSVIVLTVAPTAGHSQTDTQPDRAIEAGAGNEDALEIQEGSDWKRQHADRMKRNKGLASRIDKVIEMADSNRAAGELRAVAAKLPEPSRHAEQIRNLAQEIASNENGGDEWLTDDRRDRLQFLSSQLSFQPRMESDLPSGFPAPTPVGEMEVKSYPTYRSAKTSASGRGTRSFFRLFNHIQSNQIAMTAPVEMTYKTSDSGLQETGMAFLYGDTSIGEIQANGDVSVADVSPRQAVVLGMRGRPTDQRIAEAAAELREYAKAIGVEDVLAEAPTVFGYNSPAVSPENRFYEVLIEFDRAPQESETEE